MSKFEELPAGDRRGRVEWESYVTGKGSHLLIFIGLGVSQRKKKKERMSKEKETQVEKEIWEESKRWEQAMTRFFEKWGQDDLKVWGREFLMDEERCKEVAHALFALAYASHQVGDKDGFDCAIEGFKRLSVNRALIRHIEKGRAN